MNTIELRKLRGQKVYIHTINNEDFVRLEDFEIILAQVIAEQQSLMRQEEEASQEEEIELEGAYTPKDVVIRKKRVKAYEVGGVLYIDMTTASEVWGATNSALVQRLRWIEAERKKELEAQRQNEIAETRHSTIDPARDAKIRHQFNFQRRKRFISIPDFEKYFFSKEVQFPQSTQK